MALLERGMMRVSTDRLLFASPCRKATMAPVYVAILSLGLLALIVVM